MTAIYIAPRVPIVDPKTGICEPIWYRFFSRLFAVTDNGGVSDAEASLLYPKGESDSLTALLNQGGGDLLPVAGVAAPADDNLSPVSFQTVSAPDDLAPFPDVAGLIAAVQKQIAALPTGGLYSYTVTTQNVSYFETATSGDQVVLVTGAAVTATLPTAVGNTARFTFKLMVAGTMTLDGAGAETIDGAATASTAVQYTAITIVSDNANWVIV